MNWLGAKITELDDWFEYTAVGKYFKVGDRGTSLTRELRAGCTTFLTISYILAVHSSILSATGGPCTDDDCSGPTAGTPGCRFGEDGVPNQGYVTCVEEVRRSLVTATAVGTLVSTFFIGVLANMPLCIAPGMGMNAYFTYTVVGYYGSGSVSYQEALVAVFVEGIVFLVISICGLRAKLFKMVPRNIMLATGGGVGLFLSFIGLQNSEGLGIVVASQQNLVSLGGCPLADRSYLYAIKNFSDICYLNGTDMVCNYPLPSSIYECDTGKMRASSMWLGIAGGALMVLLMLKNVRGAVMGGIVLITAISWIPGHSASYLGDNPEFPGGESRMQYFKKVVAVPTVSQTALQWSWDGFSSASFWTALITFLYLDFLDGTGTLYSMAQFLHHAMPGGFLNERNEFPGQILALCCDAGGTMLAGILGSSPMTVVVESATGIKDGGRTGLMAISISFWFFVSLFFIPLIASIPPYATGPALVLTGALMMENLAMVDWHDLRQAIPSFLVVALIPLTFSIAYGIIAGIGSYIGLWLFEFSYELVRQPFTKVPLREICAEFMPDFLRKANDEDASVDERMNEDDPNMVGDPSHLDPSHHTCTASMPYTLDHSYHGTNRISSSVALATPHRMSVVNGAGNPPTLRVDLQDRDEEKGDGDDRHTP